MLTTRLCTVKNDIQIRDSRKRKSGTYKSSNMNMAGESRHRSVEEVIRRSGVTSSNARIFNCVVRHVAF